MMMAAAARIIMVITTTSPIVFFSCPLRPNEGQQMFHRRLKHFEFGARSKPMMMRQLR
jgi:hypothetical protein